MDPRQEPIYSIKVAAQCLVLPKSTVRNWALGHDYPVQDGRRRARPVIRPALARPTTLSFWNLGEVYVLKGIRKEYGVSLQKVRRALQFVQGELEVNSEHPLIEQDFFTDGVDLFVEKYSKLVNVTSPRKQKALKDSLRLSLKRIRRDAKGLADGISLWLEDPTEPPQVEINPRRAFGKRVLAGTSIPTETIAERFRGGDVVLAKLAKEFELTTAQVLTALRWEQCSLAQ